MIVKLMNNASVVHAFMHGISTVLYNNNYVSFVVRLSSRVSIERSRFVHLGTAVQQSQNFCHRKPETVSIKDSAIMPYCAVYCVVYRCTGTGNYDTFRLARVLIMSKQVAVLQTNVLAVPLLYVVYFIMPAVPHNFVRLKQNQRPSHHCYATQHDLNSYFDVQGTRLMALATWEP